MLPSLRAAMWALTSDWRAWFVDAVESSSFDMDLVAPVGGSVEVSRMVEGSSGWPCARNCGSCSPVDGRSLLSSIEIDVAYAR